MTPTNKAISNEEHCGCANFPFCRHPDPKPNTVDQILDRFSKAHPFADTPAYNIYHEEATQEIKDIIKAHNSTMIAKMYEVIGKDGNENLLNGVKDQTLASKLRLEVGIRNNLKEEQRDRLKVIESSL